MAAKKTYTGRCGNCNKVENFNTLAAHEDNIPDLAGYSQQGEELLGYGAISRWLIVAHCPRCKHVSLLKVNYDNSIDEEMGKPSTLWPSTSQLLVEDTYLLPPRLERLIKEFFEAEGHGLYTSAVLVLRTVAEALVEHLNGAPLESFTKGLKDAKEADKLTEQEKSNLAKAYDMGSAVIHRAHDVSACDVAAVWTIIHATLDLKIWEQERQLEKQREHARNADSAAEELASRTPARVRGGV